MRKGLSEAHVEAALGDLDTIDLPAKTVAALRLVDLLSAPQPTVDTATYQQLRHRAFAAPATCDPHLAQPARRAGADSVHPGAL